jgi:hypothetical protein
MIVFLSRLYVAKNSRYLKYSCSAILGYYFCCILSSWQLDFIACKLFALFLKLLYENTGAIENVAPLLCPCMQIREYLDYKIFWPSSYKACWRPQGICMYILIKYIDFYVYRSSLLVTQDRVYFVS